MSKNAIFFIEKDGVKKYKTDTFWSKDTNPMYAKLHHTDDVDRFLKGYLYSIESYAERHNDEFVKIKNEYKGIKYGYQTFEDDQKQSTYTLKENPILSEPVYCFIIEDIDDNGVCKLLDYKVIERDIKINEIIK